MQKLVQKFSIFVFVFLLSSCSMPDESELTYATTPKDGVLYTDAIHYLNDIRYQVGLKPFSVDSTLEQIADNHAKYCAKNSIITHNESQSGQGFTGITPDDRANFVGYKTHISENVSSGHKDEIASIDGLMSAIYHRFGFLDMNVDMIGFGSQSNEKEKYFVFNMSNSRLKNFCERGVSDSGYGKFLTGACLNPKIAIKDENFKALSVLNSKNLVVYPIGENIFHAFSNEIPNPLPECKITANPVSIEFSRHHEPVKFKNFEIFENDKKIQNTILLDKISDPNFILDERQFALFAREPFKFDTKYKAVFEYEQKGEKKALEWEFTTATPQRPYFSLQGGEKLALDAGKEYDLYFVPNDCNDLVASYRTTYSLSKPTITTVSPNTLRVKIDGNKGQKITLKTDSGKAVEIYLISSKNPVMPSLTAIIALIVAFFVVIFIFVKFLKGRK